jgi:hypothetical protein
MVSSPLSPGCMAMARVMFRHEDPRQGHVKSVTANAYTDNGRRQEYRYIVEYYGGDIKGFDVPCESVPFSMTRESLLQRIGYVTRQQFDETYFKTKDKVVSNVRRILKHRNHYRCVV